MRNILTIIKKEFNRFFRDPRMLFAMLLPGLLIYAIYSFMGGALTGLISPDENTTPVIYAVNLPESVKTASAGLDVEIKSAGLNEVADLKNAIENSECELLMIFPVDFDELVDQYDVKTSAGPAPNIEIYFNSASAGSSTVYGTMVTLLNQYEVSLVNKFDINAGGAGEDGFDLASDQELSNMILGTIMPFLTMEFLLVGCVSVAPESIAGEKERGTIATLLVTPIRRSQLAIGKIASLSVISMICGLVTMAGTVLSLPKLLGDSGTGMTIEVAYDTTQYLLLLGLILSTTLLLVSLIAILSAYAKTVKEAASMMSPITILVMILALVSMVGSPSSSMISGLIPIYNSAVAFGAVFSFDYNIMSILVTIVSNILYACLGGFVLTRMFMSERVIFNR